MSSKDNHDARKGFQSPAAREAAIKINPATDKTSEPKLASVSITKTAADEPQVAHDLSKDMELVTVRVNENLKRFRVADQWYSLQKGKPALIPRHVQRLLEEKGYC